MVSFYSANQAASGTQLEQSGQQAVLLSDTVSPIFPSGWDIPASEGAGQGSELALSV